MAHRTVRCHGKAPATPEIDLGTFRLVAQCLNHYAIPVPQVEGYIVYIFNAVRISGLTLQCMKISLVATAGQYYSRLGHSHTLLSTVCKCTGYCTSNDP
jgi:hypothetical protein